MSTILKQPDQLSFSGNMQKFVISSTVDVIFELKKITTDGLITILSQVYKPGTDSLVTISIGGIIEQLLEVTVPGNLNIQNTQSLAVGDYFARVDGVAIYLRIIKGGVSELQETASTWLGGHFLTWQPQSKMIPQASPEWIGIYPIAVGQVKLKAYYGDGTTFSSTYSELAPDVLYSINTSWSAVSAWLISQSQSGQVIAWDVWYEVGAVRKTPIQRYQLRNGAEEDNGFLWFNSLGSIDTVYFQGSSEEDKKLEHKNAIFADDTISEYKIENYRAIAQHTGFLNREERWWINDFFYSTKKYVIRTDGILQRVAVTESEVISNSQEDEHDYTFTYRIGADNNLLNLERSLTQMSAPEGLNDFFLSELLSGLTEALYDGSLVMAVQNPFAQGWQKLSLSQLFFSALSSIVDGWTIKLRNGQLCATGVGSGGFDATALQELRDYIESITNNFNDMRTELISGAVLWKIGLTYVSTIINYKIFGVKYQANSKEFTLYSDPNFSTFFTFFVDMFANVNFVAGIASANPTKPILLSTQLEVMTVLVGPGALEPSNIDVAVVYKDNDPLVEWATSYSEIKDEYVDIDYDCIDTPLTGTKCIYIKIAVPDSATNAPKHYIGEKYQGGIIFWLSADGKQGLICAEEDTATGVWFASLSGGGQSTGGRGKAIGTGQANTAAMLLQGKTKDHAVRYCDQLVVDGYSDFFMPSQDETLEMYFRRFEIGGFANKTYWTSTEANYQDGMAVSFANGVADNWDKNRAMEVRAIRKFDDAILPINVPVPTYTPTTAIMKFATPTPVSVSNGILSLNIKSSLDWQFNSMLLFESYLGNIKTGSVAMSATTNLFNYKPGDDSWQLIALQMYQFTPSKPTCDNFRVSLVGAWTNNLELRIDDVRFQHSDIIVADATVNSTPKTDYHFVETPDGIRTEFTTSLPYIPGTTKITLDGCIRLFPGDDEDYIERDGKIIFAEAPDADAGLICDYETLKN